MADFLCPALHITSFDGVRNRFLVTVSSLALSALSLALALVARAVDFQCSEFSLAVPGFEPGVPDPGSGRTHGRLLLAPVVTGCPWALVAHAADFW